MRSFGTECYAPLGTARKPSALRRRGPRPRKAPLRRTITTMDGAERPLRLDAPRDEVLAHAARLVEQAWRSFDRFRPEEPPLDERVRRLLETSLPEGPAPVHGMLDDAARILDESIAQARPRYFAFIGSSGLEIGAVADLLAHTYDINLAVDARAATEIERQAVRWVGEFVGFPATSGAFTSGGTVSNVTAIAAARERALPGSRHAGLGGRPVAVYCSEEVHYSVTRAVELLGIGSDHLRAVGADGLRRMRPEALDRAIAADVAEGVTPIAVVATAGTTLTGAIDPLEAIAEVCARHSVWLHVDGAYGLPAAAAGSRAPMFAGLDRADSCSIDAHKWLYLPKACGVVLVRERDALTGAFAHEQGYLPHQQHELHAVDITLEYSRPFRALKLWLAFRVHGAAQFRDAIERNLAEADLLYRRAQAAEDFEVMEAPPQLSVVPLRHAPPGLGDPNLHNQALADAIQGDGRIYLASALIDGEVWLRPCFVNFRTTEDDVLAVLDVARELGDRLAREGSAA
jgi:aromatic-L-amino-acid/L-tryptophan decarboxylase